MIGEKIKTYRLQRGISLSELAERAGVAKSYLSSIERNIQQNPSIQFLEKIASVFQLPAEALLPGAKTIEDQPDSEWIGLVKEAMKSGLSKDQFKDFIEVRKLK